MFIGRFQLLRFTKVVAIFLILIPFCYLPFLGGINGTAKQFVFVFFTFSCCLFWLLNNRRLTLPYIFPLFVLLLALQFFSAAQAHFPYDALLGVAVLSVGFLYLALMSQLAYTLPRFKLQIIDALLVSGLIAALLGLYQYLHFLCFGATPGWLIPALLPGINGLRISGPYGQPNLFALYLVVCLLAVFYRQIHAPDPMRCSFLRWLRFLPMMLMALVLFFTGSRAGMLAFSLIFALLAWLAASDRYLAENPGQRREFIRMALGLAAAFLLAKLWTLLLVQSGASVRDFAASGMSADARFVFWTAAALIFADHPWLGVGLDNFKFFLAEYQPQAHDLLGFVEYESMVHTKWTHNEFLQLLCEGGIGTFCLIVLFLGLFLFYFLRRIWLKKGVTDAWFLYSHLLIIPFIIQSLFSYPLRYAPLWVTFLTLLALMLSNYRGRVVVISPDMRRSSSVLLLLALMVTTVLFCLEVKIGTLRSGLVNSKPLSQKMSLFSELAENPYSKATLLQQGLLPLARYAIKNRDQVMAQKLLPYAQEAVKLQGIYWQWFYLARLDLLLGREKASREAIQVAIDRRPSFDLSWFFLHYLDVLQASRLSGRPVGSYYPVGSRTLELINGENLLLQRQQNL